jgi:hypothetical protein
MAEARLFPAEDVGNPLVPIAHRHGQAGHVLLTDVDVFRGPIL